MVQALGGARYIPWRARSRALLPADFPGLTGPKLISAVEQQMGYVIGASMLVPRVFIETVGELSESYFLYFEEIDWIRRAKGRFRMGYCEDSVVYHRLGASTGEASNSHLTWFHLSRSRVRFVAQFDPWALPLVFLLDAVDALKAFLQGRMYCAKGILGGLGDTGLRQLWALFRRRSSGSTFLRGD
jgi:GT2 family glycosyltransferase